MKLLILTLFLLTLVVTVRPPIPYCRSAPIPQLIPIAVNSTIRFDLQQVFDGFNLDFSAPKQDNIDIVPKYKRVKSDLGKSYNFTTAKIKYHNRFLGLIINGFSSELVIGTNKDETGVTVDKVVSIEDIPNMHCYDVEEIVTRNSSFAVIDCGTFKMGELVENHFLFVNLETGIKVLGGKTTDTFVNYNFLSKRYIEVIEDPMNRVLYIMRIIPRDGVDQAHQNNTYIEYFLIRDSMDPQIIEVIDYTFIGEKSLSIVDYQVAFGQLYLLAYNKGLFEIALARNGAIYMRNFFEIKMDMYRFRVDRIGFNDDLYVVMTNGNQIYAYEWDVVNPPKLIQKYGLMAGAYIQQLVCDTEFVIVTARTELDGQPQRKHWIFSRESSSYTHAFNVFDAPAYGPAIMQWQGNDNTLHLFHQYSTYNIKISLPYLEINPAKGSKAGSKEEYTVTAISTGDNNQTANCSQKFTFIYQYPNDTSIIKTGLRQNIKIVVDSPDEQQIDLTREFYGMNLTYNISFEVNSSILPRTYIDKIHQATFDPIEGLKVENIVWYEMFKESTEDERFPKSVYGLIQVVEEETKNQTNPTYTAHYVHCRISVLDRDNTHSLSCRIISSTRFGMGKIILASQMFDEHERRLAVVFNDSPNVAYIYYFWQAGFGYYGRKVYAGDAWTQLSGITINKGKLFCVLEISKKIEVYSLTDLREEGSAPIRAFPILNITSEVMRFFGVDYWAPVQITVSPFHNEVLFVKTKIGVMAINVNQEGFPELLFHIVTDNVRYDLQVNEQNLLVIDEERAELYHLYTPLRRTAQPYLRQIVNAKFNLNEYSEITSDRLFYLVGFDVVTVINPFWTNTNAVYQQLYFDGLVVSIDAVNIEGRELLFVHTTKDLFVYVIRESPVLIIGWPAHQPNFNMTIGAYNNFTQSQNYNYTYTVLQTNETEITPTSKFNAQEIKKIGHIRVREQGGQKRFTFNVTFNDTEWFNGNVFHYSINCTHCGNNSNIKLQNHVQEIREVVTGLAIYDMESTFNGIFAQQFNSYLKTWAHNDSIEYIQKIPTIFPGEVCSKIVPDHNNQYVLSLCETGDEVNVYITSLISDKPFTLGPFPTEARSVNHAKVVDDILMIVDNEDNPFARNGGVYLYSLTFGDNVEMAMIDLIDNDDFRGVEGFSGTAAVGSADFHDSHGIQQYRIFITDAFSGKVFVFSFELSPDRQQIVYLSKKMVDIIQYIPEDLQAPSQLKLITVNIHYYFSYDEDNTAQYYLLLTIANWHHIDFFIVMDRTDNIKMAKVLRMFERIPWELGNYFKLKREWHKSQFAVPYVNHQMKRQVVAVYQADWIVTPLTQQQLDNLDTLQKQSNLQLVQTPLNRILGVWRVLDTSEVAFAFHAHGLNTLLFTDTDGINITQLQINQNVTLTVKDITEPDFVNVTAHNPYNNFTFAIEMKYIDEDEEEREEKENIIWIVIIGIAGFMIISLLVVYIKQKVSAVRAKKTFRPENKESLITVEDKYKEDYINRSSVDPESQRGTVDYGMSDSLLGKTEENMVQEKQPSKIQQVSQEQEQ